MDPHLIDRSLKYTNKNYKETSNVSKQIYSKLENHNYKESKFIKSLDKKDFETIKTLIKFNEDVILLSNYIRKYCVCVEDHYHIIELLISHINKSLNLCKHKKCVCKNNNEALEFASDFGHFRTVKLLLENGADVHVNDDQPLRSASESGRFDVVKLLIDNGAYVHANNYSSVLYASFNNHPEVVKLLIINAPRSNQYNDALENACIFGRLEVVKILVKRADVNYQESYSLRCASSTGYFEIVKLLLENGADVHARDDEALINASYNGRFEVVKILLDYGANIHADHDKAIKFAYNGDNYDLIKLFETKIELNKTLSSLILNITLDEYIYNLFVSQICK